MPIVTLSTPDAPSLLEIDEFGATEQEYDAVRDRRLPVLVSAVPDGVHDLRVLAPVADVLEHLSVFASGVSDFEALIRMPRLSSLTLDSKTTGVRDLCSCAELRHYYGSFGQTVRLRDDSAYDGLILFGTDFSSLASWHGSVRDLRFMANRRVALDLTGLQDQLRGVEELTLDGFSSVQLPPASSCSNLRTLTIRRGTLTGLEGMVAVPGLEIDLEDVRSVANWKLVTPPVGGRITLRGRSPADAAFRASHHEQQGWYFSERTDH